MNFIKRIAAPLTIIAVSIFSMLIFRVIPSAKLWEDYSIMFVPVGADTQIIHNVLTEKGCKDFICIENQFVPLKLSADTPEISLALSGAENSNYLRERNNFFFDKSGKFEIYYVPDKYKRNIDAAVNVLNRENDIKAAVNDNSSYPWICPLSCVFLMLILGFFSERKFLSLLSAVIPVFYVFMFPFYSAAAAVSLILCAIFLTLRLWGRRKAFKTLVKNGAVIFLYAFSFIPALSSGIIGFSFFVIAASAQLCTLYIYVMLNSMRESKYSFRPVKILGARIIKINTKKACTGILIGFIICLSLVLSALLSFYANSTSGINEENSSGLLFPAARGSGGKFPDIQDFIEWKWETLTYPYISLNSRDFGKKPVNGTEISFPRYEISDGAIVETENAIVFDSGFKKNAINEIDELSFPAVEKLLKRQKTLSLGYARSSSQTVTVFIIITLAFAAAVPLFYYFNWKTAAVRRRK